MVDTIEKEKTDDKVTKAGNKKPVSKRKAAPKAKPKAKGKSTTTTGKAKAKATKKKTVAKTGRKAPAKPTKRRTKAQKASDDAKKNDEALIDKVSGGVAVVSDDLIDDLSGDGASEDQLTIIRSKSEEAAELMRRMNNGEKLMKSLKETYNELVTVDIPKRMLAADMDLFQLTDGTQVKINEIVTGSLPKNAEKRADAIKYLDELEASALLRPTINLPLAVGEEPVAKAAINACKKITGNKKRRDALKAVGISDEEIEALKLINDRASISYDVHHQTLCAFARSLLQNAKDIDCKRLGLYDGKVAKITLSKD